MPLDNKNRIIRRLELSDLPEIWDIERNCFADPWSLDSFRGVIQNKLFYNTGIFEQSLAGYLISIRVADELHILNIAIRPEKRRKGLAESLYDHTFSRFESGISLVYLEVRMSNLPALSFYRKLGFTDAGIRKQYYHDGEDAILMTLSVEH